MSTPLYKSWSEPAPSMRYGASMGRPAVNLGAKPSERFTLQRVRLDTGGYDQGGAYWGCGEPLYWYSNPTGTAEGYCRAWTRDKAKAQVRDLFPTARFFR